MLDDIEIPNWKEIVATIIVAAAAPPLTALIEQIFGYAPSTSLPVLITLALINACALGLVAVLIIRKDTDSPTATTAGTVIGVSILLTILGIFFPEDALKTNSSSPYVPFTASEAGAAIACVWATFVCLRSWDNTAKASFAGAIIITAIVALFGVKAPLEISCMLISLVPYAFVVFWLAKKTERKEKK